MPNSVYESMAFTMAVEDLQAIPYFPREEGAKMAIAEALGRFVRNENEVRWLVRTTLDHMREWRGIAELRALYCTRYPPLDGIDPGPCCTVPGFTAADSERMIGESRPQKYLPTPGDSQI